MNQIMNDDDIVIDLQTQRHIRQFLNKEYGLMKDCVDYNLSVPVDKRDRLYYLCVSVVRTNVEQYERTIMALYKCKLITYAKKEYILDKLQAMKEALDANVEVKLDESCTT